MPVDDKDFFFPELLEPPNLAKISLTRNNRYLIAESKAGHVVIYFGTHELYSGKAGKTYTVNINDATLDFMAIALMDRSTANEKNHTSIRLPDHYLTISWQDKAARVLTIGEYESQQSLTIRLSPIEAYQLSKICERTAWWNFFQVKKNEK